jgi:hypothetical protein
VSARRSSTAFAERLPCTNPTHDANAAVSACDLLSNRECQRGVRAARRSNGREGEAKSKHLRQAKHAVEPK